MPSTILEPIIYPAVYMLWKGRGMRREEAQLSLGQEV